MSMSSTTPDQRPSPASLKEQIPPFTHDLIRNIHRAIIETSRSTSIKEVLKFENIEPEIGRHVVGVLLEDGEIERIRPRITFNSLTRVLKVRL